MPISMVRGRDGSPSLRPAPRRVDNLRTEWLSIYLFLVVGLPCSRAGNLSQGCGNPGTPRWTRPDTPARPTGFAIAPRRRTRPRARVGPARDLVRGAVLKKGPGTPPEKKRILLQRFTRKQAQKHQQNYTSTSNTQHPASL